jgi:hypothetical protein
MSTRNHKNTVWACLIFSITMAYLEATIVVYLRALYYPDGFHFPLVEIPLRILFTEAGRELATIVMLGIISGMAGKNRRQRFAFFIYNFGIWDLAYYFWLKILLNWPASLLDWDVLFLIPLPWLGPVLPPVLVSVCLILAACVILHYEKLDRPLQFKKWEWGIEIIAGILIVLTFFFELRVIPVRQVPGQYPWGLFIIGLGLGLVVFLQAVYRHHHNRMKNI